MKCKHFLLSKVCGCALKPHQFFFKILAVVNTLLKKYFLNLYHFIQQRRSASGNLLQLMQMCTGCASTSAMKLVFRLHFTEQPQASLLVQVGASPSQKESLAAVH